MSVVSYSPFANVRMQRPIFSRESSLLFVTLWEIRKITDNDGKNENNVVYVFLRKIVTYL